ncbi:putative cuticle protein [Ixodes scapularis]
MASMPSTIFALCETWLDPSMFDSHIIPLDLYTVFRRDRSSSRGGGVMLAIPSSFPCHRLCDLESDELEALFVEITFNKKKHLVACVYCPPAVRSESYKQLRRSVERMVSVVGKYHNILVLGDFNAHIDWHDPLSPTPQDLASDSLLDIMDTNGFTQLCTEPTYTSPPGSTSYLDLCFVSNPTLVCGCRTLLLCCLFAYVACGVVVEHAPSQPYSFGFDNVDEFGTRMTRQETGDEFNNKVGSYSYVDAFGVTRVVKYVADATGFHPTVETNEPGTKTSVPADAPFFSSAVEGPHPVVVKAAPVAAVHAVHAAPVAVRAVHAAPVVHAAPFAYAHHAPLAYGLAKHF